MDVYVEVGKTRTFASAVAWPGWGRSGRDEPAALEALLDSAARYARALRGTRLGFRPPTALRVVERLTGNATTDFGAPDVASSSDGSPIADPELRRLGSILRASWRTFDAAVDSASGTTLRTGPRGGGRDVDKIVEHVQGSEASYLTMIGGKRWVPRYFVRRVAWHVLDHAWEIEDRTE